MTQLSNLVSGVNSKPPTVVPNKAGRTTIPEVTAPVVEKTTVPVAHAEGLAHLIPSSSMLPNDPQKVSASIEETPLPRFVTPPYSQDGSGHIFRNVAGMRPMMIATVQNDCKMVELMAMLNGLLVFECKVPPPATKG